MKYDILYFPWRDYNKMLNEGFRTREANVLLGLLRSNKVNKILCVNRSGQPAYVNTLIRLFKSEFNVTSRLDGKVLRNNFFSKLFHIEDKLFVLDMKYYLPNPKGNKLEEIKFFKSILSKEVRSAVSSLKLNQQHLVWSSDLSRTEAVIKMFPENEFIFDAIDNLLEHDQSNNDLKVKSNYDKVFSDSDIIFTVSKNLKEVLFKNDYKAHFIPNGIMLDKYKVKDVKCKKNIYDINKPIVGYVGLLQQRIDVDLIEYVANELQDFQFVFVGPILAENHFNKLRKLSNITFVGAIHHDQVPEYIHSFDVAIIPHIVNSFTQSMNPLKLYEYLACSKQIVTTPVPPSEEFDDVLYVAKDKFEFKDYIIRSVIKPFEKFNKEDIEKIIRRQDWSDRVDQMLTIIENNDPKVEVI